MQRESCCRHLMYPGIISSFVDLVNLKHADCVAKHPIPQVSSMLVNKPIRASIYQNIVINSYLADVHPDNLGNLPAFLIL